MKFSLSQLLAVAALSSSVPAMAQSAIRISGILDVGARIDSGAQEGSVRSVGSGLSNASRLTFSGAEDLGGGLRAVFVLESGLALDTGIGANNPPGAAAGAMTWGRTSLVGVGGPSTGFLTFGRQYTPLWAASAGPATDPFGASWLGGINTVYSTTVRSSNALAYTYGYGDETTLNPPPRTGLGVSLVWSLSEATAPAPSDSGDQKGAAISYGDGNWWAVAAYHQIKGSNASINATAPVTNQPLLKQYTLAGTYRFAFGSLHAGINGGRNGLSTAAGVDRRNWHLAATIPLGEGLHTLRMLYGSAKDRTAADLSFKTFQIGYQYALSKRTWLYSAFGTVANNSNAAATLAASLGTYAKGSTPKSLTAGLGMKF